MLNAFGTLNGPDEQHNAPVPDEHHNIFPCDYEVRSISRMQQDVADGKSASRQISRVLHDVADGTETFLDRLHSTLRLGRSSYQTIDTDEALDNLECLSELPAWCVRDTIVEMARGVGPQAPLPLTVTAGAVIPLAFVVTIILWSCYLSVPLLVGKVSACSDSGFAYCPLWVWFVFLPILSGCTALELISFKFVIIPKYQVLRRFTLCGCELPFYLWFSCRLAESVAQYGGVISFSIFIGAMMKTPQCSPHMQDLWVELFDNSSFGYLFKHINASSFGFMCSFRSICIVCWFIYLLKLLYVIADTVPSMEEMHDVNYELCIDDGRQYKTNYETFINKNPRQNHGAALMSLAEVNGMRLIVFNDHDFANKKAEALFSRRDKGFAAKTLSHALSQIRRCVFTTLVTGTFVRGSQLNLQITALALEANLKRKHMGEFSHGREFSQLILSIIFHTIPCVITAFTSINIFFMSLTWYRKLKRIASDGEEEQIELEKQMRCFRWWLYSCFLSYIIFVVWFGYGMVKFAFSFFCPHAMWNVTGCVGA